MTGPAEATKYQRVMAAADLPEGKMQSVELDGKNIVICHVKGAWYALDNMCTHALAQMSEGRLRGVRLMCPLHGGSFDCRTGAVMGAPATRPLKTYAIRQAGDDIEVAT